MAEQTKNYEAMFMVDAPLADFETVSQPIRTILERNEAQILSFKPWEERRLAFDVSGHRRGLYILTYFKADPQRIVEIEHDAQLNEQILRLLVLHRENITDEMINAETPATSGRRSVEDRREEDDGEYPRRRRREDDDKVVAGRDEVAAEPETKEIEEEEEEETTAAEES